MTERPLPPRPAPSSSRLPSMPGPPSTEFDFWAGLFLDLSVRVEWLGQVLDAVPKEDASASALVRLRSYAHAIQELHQRLAPVQAHRNEPGLKILFTLDGPLAGYLSRLYAWCETIGDDFERMAVALRRNEPTSTVFSHRAVNDSYAEFTALIAAVRETNDAARAKRSDQHDHVWRAFEEHIEELMWSTEWVHMTLARRPGD